MQASRIMSAAKKMTTREKFMFDLNGFIVLRGLVSTEEVAQMNRAITEHIGDVKIRESAPLKNTIKGSALSADGSRMDLGGMLGWPGEQGDMFRRLLCHRNITPYLHELVGEGYRLDHQPMVLVQEQGSEGFSLHGGPLSGHDGVPEGKFNPELQYVCRHGMFWNSLLAMSVQLVDAKKGDGGFCALRGSHKLNFPQFDELVNGDAPEFAEHIYQPEVKAGDVIIFSEATVHGSLPWKAAHQRRLALYRFSPANFAYGRAYLNQWGPGVLEKCTPQQAAVLGPPHAVRLERPTITTEGEDSEIQVYKRSKAKKDHDLAVFGSDYF